MQLIILRSAALVLKPLMLLFAIYLLMRGHNAPGGGFVGGLVAAAGFTLDALAHGPEASRRSLNVPPRLLVGAGLLLAIFSGLAGLLQRAPYMTAYWTTLNLPAIGELKLGTPLFFDVGVFLAVMGFTLLFIMTLMEDTR